MSKKSLLVVFLIAIFLPMQFGNVVASTSEPINDNSSSVTQPVGTKLADVTGVIKLKAQRKQFPDNLVDLFTGADSKLPKKRNLQVTGEYRGGSVVTVVEVDSSKEPEFSFDIPVISSVMKIASSSLTKEVAKGESVVMIFTNANDAPDVDDASHRFLGKAISKRKGSKGTNSGSFNEQGAKGRFVLKFDFDVDSE